MNFKNFKNLYSNLVDFYCQSDDNGKNKFLIMSHLLDTFDDFIDDLISSDVNLLKGELDFLLMQYLFNSIDLKLINKNETKEEESLAA